MIEDVKEVGIESQLRTFCDLEGLADTEVVVDEMRAWNGTAPHACIAPPATVHVSRAGKYKLATERVLSYGTRSAGLT